MITPMSREPGDEITQLLHRLASGDSQAEEKLIPQVYDELRKLAAMQLRRERNNHTLDPTALVHEVYLRLLNRPNLNWQGRAHFYGVAAQVMRHVLVDYARQRRAEKRGGTRARIPLGDALSISDEKCETVLNLNDALDRLEKIDARQAKIVVMRYFGGLTEEEIALLLGISARTVKRDWVVAKAWLKNALGSDPTSPEEPKGP
jgi:RNA polymerase sigma-70 factor, ECF subfamily